MKKTHGQKTDHDLPRLGRRLVLIPGNLQGHLNPMLQLGTLLHSKGFSITIAHTFDNFPNQCNYPDFSFESIYNGHGFPDIFTILSIIKVCAEPLKDCLASLLLKSKEEDYEPVVCIISDSMMSFTKEAADSLKLPRMVLKTAGAICYIAFKFTIELHEQDCFPESRLEERLPNILPLKFKDLPAIKPNDNGFFDFVSADFKNSKASSGLIFNTFEDLEKSVLTAITNEDRLPVFAIGPLHKFVTNSPISLLSPDSTCITWLDKQSANSVIYVSFGSLAGMDKIKFNEIAWGLANSGHPFLWVLRPNSVTECSQPLEFLPEGFHKMVEGRYCIVQWAPQQEVLAHPAVGGFWTHSGWNSTLESIYEGVPMLCMPCFADQHVNARFVSEEWKVGLLFENGLEKGEIERSITKLMQGKERDEMMARVKVLQVKAKDCIKESGKSSESLQSLIDYILSF